MSSQSSFTSPSAPSSLPQPTPPPPPPPPPQNQETLDCSMTNRRILQPVLLSKRAVSSDTDSNSMVLTNEEQQDGDEQNMAKSIQAYLRAAISASDITPPLPEKELKSNTAKVSENPKAHLPNKPLVTPFPSKLSIGQVENETNPIKDFISQNPSGLDMANSDHKTVVDGNGILLMNQRKEHFNKIDEAKMRTPFELNITFSRDLTTYVTPHALHPLLLVRDFATIKPHGRPVGSVIELPLRSQMICTQRDPFLFERVNAAIGAEPRPRRQEVAVHGRASTRGSRTRRHDRGRGSNRRVSEEIATPVDWY
ncbi:hypothetical protein EPUL_002669 [Erysiphe pulchra]|uniref:Uncharacterized protein n=1 Tax=Erysiphe pulchra TaxID=225359 RepID=A0A2S4PZB6_9PEZI|nr:hypothetical protein EPUL_002669 [Erysiphe pulchra]